MTFLREYWQLIKLQWFGGERDWRQDRQCLNDAPNLREAFDIPQHDLLIERLQKCREWREKHLKDINRFYEAQIREASNKIAEKYPNGIPQKP